MGGIESSTWGVISLQIVSNPFGSKTKVAGVVERLKENVSLFSGGLIKFCGALRIVIFAWLLDEFSMATTTPVYIELLSSGNTE